MADQYNPPGWDYNPSSWSQRLPIVILALIGTGVATYITLYQYGVFPTVWEPFFGQGSAKVLDSPLSRLLPGPITDGLLGAITYLVDAIAGAVGGRARWRTMPWIVILFGIAIGPLGAVSIFLTIAQPVILGNWCTLCLTSAAISLLMIGPAMDEVLASLQYLKQAKREGLPLWGVFWGTKGGHDLAPDVGLPVQRAGAR